MIRILIIDKTAVLAANHERFRALAAHEGIQLHVLSPHRWFEHGRSVALECRQAEGYRIHAGHGLRQGHYGSGWYATGLGRAILRSKPDIIQLLEEPWSFFAGQTMRWARLLAPRAKLLFYSWENIYRDFDYVSRLRRLYRRIDKRMYRRAAGAVVATDSARRVLDLKGFDKPVAVIPYGVGEAFFAAGQQRLLRHATRQTGTFRVGYVGRLLEMKGVQHLIEALLLVDNTELLIVGNGEYEQVLRAQAQRLGVMGRVQFEPACAPEDVPVIFDRLDALALPSQRVPHWAEQLGRVVIEAMAAGVPVIASDSGALPEVLGDAGVLFREGKARELAERLIYVRDNDAIRQALMLRGRERAQARFAWPRFAEDLLAFYQRDILTERTP